MKNKSFGITDGKSCHTPFHQVHLAQSGEIVNELNSPICSVEIDEIPTKSRRDNAGIIMRCLNSHDDMVQTLEFILGFLYDPEKPMIQGKIYSDTLAPNSDEKTIRTHIIQTLLKAKGLNFCKECQDEIKLDSADELCFTCRELENNRRYRSHNNLGEYQK